METFKQQQQLKHNCGGFVKHMNINVCEEVQNMLPMVVVTFPNVISLSLHQGNVFSDTLDMNLLFKSWTKLQSFHTCGNFYLPAACVNKCRGLTEIELMINKDVMLNFVLKLIEKSGCKLTKLSIFHCKNITLEDIVPVIHHCPNLKYLLFGAHFADSFNIGHACPNLITLHISVDDLTDEAILGISQLIN